MSRTYSPLPAPGLHASVDFHKPATGDTRPVTLDDAATAVMTDFRKVRALTIHGAATMERAYDKMITNGVRLLLVVDSRNRVVGLSKSTDVEGEKPLRIIQDRRIRRAEILVSDVMTPRERLEVLDMDDVQFAHVGHVAATLKAVGRRHALVVDSDERVTRPSAACSPAPSWKSNWVKTSKPPRSRAASPKLGICPCPAPAWTRLHGQHSPVRFQPHRSWRSRVAGIVGPGGPQSEHRDRREGMT